mgnify:CR=1 FL=1
MTAEIILWTTVFFMVYTYLLYPTYVLLSAVRAGRLNHSTSNSNSNSNSALPFVSIIMTVFNEEKVIKKKIESLLATDYPPESFEVIIGSDASYDSTDSVISIFKMSSENIIFYRSEKRKGKAAMLNDLVIQAKGEILIITDANVIPDNDAIRLLAVQFSNPMTGLCDATVRTSNRNNLGITQQENFYTWFETVLKRAEGDAWGTMTGPYGGFYAVRRTLFPILPENLLVDDLFVGRTALKHGYLSFNVREAIVFEDTPPEIYDQFLRRVRIAAGAFQNLFYFGPFPGKSIQSSFCFFSHKVLRWFTPLLITLVFMTTIILSGHSLFYFCLLSLQLIFIFLSALDMVLNWVGTTLRPLRFATQFIMMNAALAAGFVKALKGIKRGIWEPTKRI